MNKMYKPEISVIMPAYNAAQFISEAVNSVLNQTFQKWELIIIADAPTDKTLQIAKEYGKKDKRIKVISLSKNQGPAHARNTGMKRAKGRYIANLDADDTAAPTRLEVEYNFLEDNKEFFLIGFPFEYLGEKGNLLGKEKPCPLDNKSIFISTQKIPNSSIMFRNTKDIRYKANLSPVEDFEFLLNLHSKNKRIKMLDSPLGNYRIHENALSSKQAFLSKELTSKIIQIYKKFPQSAQKRNRKLRNLALKNLIPRTSKAINLKRTLSALYESEEFKEYRAISNKNIFKKPIYFKKEIFYYLLSFIPKNIKKRLKSQL